MTRTSWGPACRWVAGRGTTVRMVRITSSRAGASLIASVGVLYAAWLVVVYSRGRYDAPCGALVGPRAGTFGFDLQGTCGVTHWWTAGLAAFSVALAAAVLICRARPAALPVVVGGAIAAELGALLVLTLIAQGYPEPVLGEAWRAARSTLATTVAVEGLMVAAALLWRSQQRATSA